MKGEQQGPLPLAAFALLHSHRRLELGSEFVPVSSCSDAALEFEEEGSLESPYQSHLPSIASAFSFHIQCKALWESIRSRGKCGPARWFITGPFQPPPAWTTPVRRLEGSYAAYYV